MTERAGLQGHGYEMGTAIGDYNNDGLEDIYVVGVHGNTLYRNNGDGTFTDVTEAAGVSGAAPDGRRLWSVAAAWIDYDNDGNLDLFVSNYCDWEPGSDPVCGGSADVGKHSYCHPDRYRAEPMVLYHNNGNGSFSEVSQQTGLAQLLGKGMGVAVADFAGDGRPGLFVANDNARNLLIRNRLGKLQEIGIEARSFVRLRLPKRTPRVNSSRSSVRRSRIISAMIEIAISSGVSPPIATPSGACTSFKRSAGTPVSPIRSSVALTRRREPIIPTNPHGCIKAARTTSSS